MITSIVPMHEHGCILTVSLDGFHRVWNIDKACLGEMPLPNIVGKYIMYMDSTLLKY